MILVIWGMIICGRVTAQLEAQNWKGIDYKHFSRWQRFSSQKLVHFLKATKSVPACSRNGRLPSGA
jgi:hypothetical protein